MIQTILWTFFLALIPTLLGVGKDLVNLVIKAVQEAEDLKDENGNPLPGAKKKEYVLNKLETELRKLTLAQRVVDALISIAVNYVTFLLKSKPEVTAIQPKSA